MNVKYLLQFFISTTGKVLENTFYISHVWRVILLLVQENKHNKIIQRTKYTVHVSDKWTDS